MATCVKATDRQLKYMLDWLREVKEKEGWRKSLGWLKRVESTGNICAKILVNDYKHLQDGGLTDREAYSVVLKKSAGDAV